MKLEPICEIWKSTFFEKIVPVPGDFSLFSFILLVDSVSSIVDDENVRAYLLIVVLVVWLC